MPFVGFGEGNLTPYEKALSDRMADAYPEYFNSLGLTDPKTGAAITIGKELEGSGYAYLMKKLEQSAAKYLKTGTHRIARIYPPAPTVSPTG